MNDDVVLTYLQEMEHRLKKEIEIAKHDIIEEIETSLMEVGVYKKEIMDSIRKNSKVKMINSVTKRK
ncbi:MAG: hypothetical protein EPN93_10865 [Spirochaetes bacterium]|nr:MAG: hypothetical protein EPN93_10865 [Spirochaetota bacterium]